MNKEKNNDYQEVDKKQLVAVILLLIMLVLLVIGVTYQVYIYGKNGDSVINQIINGGDDDERLNPFKNGSVTLVYTEGDSGITIENALPMTDSEGRKMIASSQMMNFTVTANIKNSRKIGYEVVAEKDKKSTLNDKYIKVYLEKSTDNYNFVAVNEPRLYNGISETDDYGVTSGNMIIDKVENIDKDVTYYYRLRMWLDGSYSLSNSNKYFSLKVSVYGKAE